MNSKLEHLIRFLNAKADYINTENIHLSDDKLVSVVAGWLHRHACLLKVSGSRDEVYAAANTLFDATGNLNHPWKAPSTFIESKI